MRFIITLGLALALIEGLRAADHSPPLPQLTLSDEGLPLTEIRPNDRHVYILTLDGRWQKPAVSGVVYYVNVFYPNGQVVSHRAPDELQFRRGDVPVLFQEYELRNNLPRGAAVQVAVSTNRAVTALAAPEVISNPLPVTWPTTRSVLQHPPRTRHAPPEDSDAFPPGGPPPRTVSPDNRPPPPPPGATVRPKPIPEERVPVPASKPNPNERGFTPPPKDR